MFEDERVQALARAAGRGRIREVDRLVNEGADVNARGTQGVTPLFWTFRNKKGFRRLLEIGADPNVVYDDHTSIMHFAVEVPDADFLRMAHEYGGDPNLRAGPLDDTPLFRAVWSDEQDKMKLLIMAGGDLNARRTHDGNTPLLSATLQKQCDVAYLLLKSGADYSVRNKYGQSILNYMAINRPLMDQSSDEWQWMLSVSDWLRRRGMEVTE